MPEVGISRVTLVNSETQGCGCGACSLLQALADAIASWFVPVVTLIAAATFATWLGLGLSGRLNPELLPAGTTPLLLALLSAGTCFSQIGCAWRWVVEPHMSEDVIWLPCATSLGV